MYRSNIWKIVVIALTLSLVLAATSTLVGADPVRSTAVTGELSSQYSQIWLAVVPDQPEANLRLTLRIDNRGDIPANVGFWILDANQTNRVVNGEPFSANNVAAGLSMTSLANNELGAQITASGLAEYTVVIYNDGPDAIVATLMVSGGKLVDESGTQVKDALAPAMDAEPEATATTPAAVVPAAAPVTATPAPAETAEAETAAEPAMAGPYRGTELAGELPNQGDRHYFKLVANNEREPLTVVMEYNPQDQQLLDRGLNLFAFNQDGLRKLVLGAQPTAVNLATGESVANSPGKQKSFTIHQPVGEFALLIDNSSTVAGSYTLTVSNGMLEDGSAQSITAQEAMKDMAPAATTGTAAATPRAATTAPAAVVTTIAVGTTYTVQSGDTLGIIARAAYGDVSRYSALCAYNNITNCNLIEVGQEIQIPPLSELGSSSTAATTTSAAPAASTPAATPTVAATTAVTDTATTAPTATTAATNIVETAQAAGTFKTLLALLDAAGLTDALKGAGPFTVFAPTDEAFAKLPAATLASLSADPVKLAEVLRYHVVAGRVMAADLAARTSVETLQASPLTVTVKADSSVMVNDATVTTSNIVASNGIIHVVDTVLIPSAQ